MIIFLKMDLKQYNVNNYGSVSNYGNEILKNKQPSPYNIKEMCRFCLYGNANNNIFQVRFGNTIIYNLCKDMLFTLDSNDDLPKNICENCLYKVMEFAKFKKRIIEVEKMLINSIHQNSGEIKSNLELKYEQMHDKDSMLNIYSNSAANQNISCKICNASFGNNYEYKRHKRMHFKTRSMPCKICKKQCRTNSLKKHLQIHSKSEMNYNFQCDVCGKNYQTQRNLKRHYLTHTGMPHVCHICGKGKKRKTYKYCEKSEKPMTKSQKSSFPCEICGKIYASRTIVNYHVLTHNPDKKFQCNDCGKLFANKSILGDHRRIHRLSYKCKFCNKAFAYAASLETHINSHTGEKPHKCTICEKRYSNKSHLKEHIRIHTGERPYICSICGKTFAVKGNLNGHLKTHSKINVM
ncbi:zinc finger protein 711-like isoform X2 [Rhynchophorus ferrugineus]|uniref:zinc finger protein 711-like isoform X2 n=1 Tax=Rhynchophorus ferrugineus TaxID=354439 RepID=UPI003FCC492A